MKSSTKTALIVIVSLVGIGFLVGAGYLFAQGTFGDDPTAGDQVPDDQVEETGVWADRIVNHHVSVEDLTGATPDGEADYLYVFNDQPENWEDQRQIDRQLSGDYDDRIALNGDTVTISEVPGTHYVVAEVEDHYYGFETVEIPSEPLGSESLSEYNSNPQQTSVEVAEAYALSSETFDVEITEETQQIREWDASETFQPDRDSEYRLWRTTIMTGAEAGDTDEYVDPTQDSNNNGNYDEGIERAWIEITGDSQDSHEFFNPNSGVDELGTTGDTTVDMNMEFDRESPMTVNFYLETFSTALDPETAEPEDETLTVSEIPFAVQFHDGMGQASQLMNVEAVQG